jgi:ribose transport system permease protein
MFMVYFLHLYSKDIIDFQLNIYRNTRYNRFKRFISGILLTSRLYSAQPNSATGYELDAIAAAVLGGTSLSGGYGTVFGTFIGALIMGVINNGMNLIGLPYFYQQIVKGLIIIVAVYLDVRNKERILGK